MKKLQEKKYSGGTLKELLERFLSDLKNPLPDSVAKE